ncbi:ABC transporter ATP-binding protein [Pseudofrankia sp. BMG5.37]|uniref:ABC transporter ATP-binding protein n=1 Tax=Pseudofrankia sp. BMG5.37 TaxID=3050035 RepID=UPI002894C8A9|nr:ABC transporter ATP-binding protein [Pseudofrankia sp. BMG5.37]MDT3444732.1 ABC transporter ATP-binding protein [Pseudofrankia sp. BMG5.37]
MTPRDPSARAVAASAASAASAGAPGTGPARVGLAGPADPSGTSGALLAAVELRKRFGATPALDGASLRVDAGEIVALMGPSGSGKSTLLHCLAGIIGPDAGEVHYGTRRLSAMSEAGGGGPRRGGGGGGVRRGQPVPPRTTAENVALPLRLGGVGRRAARERARAQLARLGVDDVAGKRPGEVSGGQGQRVAVARALVTEPRVIFADEPTGALDSLNGEEVMRLLTQAAREAATAVVLVTHDARVAAYSDREVVVRDGRTRSLAG